MGKRATRKRPGSTSPRSTRRRTGSARRKGKKSVAREYFEAILLAVVLALFLRTLVIQAFRIPSASMEDTLLVGDFLLANKFLYGARVPFTGWRLPAVREPRPGDIIIFQYPREPDRDFVKRCVAGPGQTVEVRDKVLYVDGERTVDPPRSKYADPRVFKRGTRHGNRDNFGPATVPPGHYFVMGDNRDNSEDSRSWGFLPHGLIRGKAFILYGSWAPDPQAPAYTGLVSVPGMVLYNLIHFPQRVRWGRIGSLVR